MPCKLEDQNSILRTHIKARCGGMHFPSGPGEKQQGLFSTTCQGERPYLKQKGASLRDIPGCPLASVHKRLHRHKHINTPVHACAHTHTMTQVVCLPVGARVGQYVCAGGCVVWSWARGGRPAAAPVIDTLSVLVPSPQGTTANNCFAHHICLCYDRTCASGSPEETPLL